MCKISVRTVKAAALTAILITSILAAGCSSIPGNSWRTKLAADLPVLGHRNWIVVADSAYPAQSRPGIETIATNADHLEVTKSVLETVDKAPHVRPTVYLDVEMKYVAEESAPGIDAYRKTLYSLLDKHPVKSIPHEQLIAKLDEAAKTFTILILKTDFTIPYTSVFIELDCGYWSTESERKLRRAMQETIQDR